MKFRITILFTVLFGSAFIASAQDTSKVKKNEPVSDFAEVEPEFPGGDDAMIKFIQSNVQYPEYSRELGEQGTVYVQFVINTDGTISEVAILKGVSDSLNAEAMRVVEAMPNWTPGMQAGKYIRVRYLLPISFTITNSGRKKKKK